jgi:hypothetical protein
MRVVFLNRLAVSCAARACCRSSGVISDTGLPLRVATSIPASVALRMNIRVSMEISRFASIVALVLEKLALPGQGLVLVIAGQGLPGRRSVVQKACGAQLLQARQVAG